MKTFKEIINENFIFSDSEKVYYVLSQVDYNLYDLDIIRVKKEYKNQGVFIQFLNELVNWADENKNIVALTPASPNNESNPKRLLKKYKEYGFVNNTGNKKDFRTRGILIRYPK